MHRQRRYTFALFLVCASGLYLTLIQTRGYVDTGTISHSSVLRSLQESHTSLEEPPPSSVPLNTSNNPCFPGTYLYDTYCVLSPYNNSNFKGGGLITLCTQGTAEFLQHVVVLCERWSAPISVAVYCTLDDYEETRSLVELLRECDVCVRSWVSWHFFYRPQSMHELRNFTKAGNCSRITQEKSSSRKRNKDETYPINVGRNIARRLSVTHFVFSIDIELYPSLHIPTKFERMLKSTSPHAFGSEKHVWAVPVFEVKSQYRAPLTKSGLRNMYLKQQAISFHKYRCDICHKIPNLTQWINHKDEGVSEIEDILEPLKIWTTVKRSKHYRLHYWEPFFIGTNRDPEFDIRLSWEGKQNKMQVAYEMCMENYDFHIIENAFLVHTPGINIYNASKEKFRTRHAQVNFKIIKDIKKKLIEKYKSSKNC